MDQAFICRYDTSSIKEEIQKYFSSGYLCDFKVICGKTIYNIHKLMLAVACPQLWHFFNEDDQIDVLNLSNFDEYEVSSFIYALYQLRTNANPVSYSSILKNLNTQSVVLPKDPRVKMEEIIMKENHYSEESSYDLITTDQINDGTSTDNTEVKVIKPQTNIKTKLKPSFQCDKCSKLFFNSLAELRNHKETGHNKVFTKNIRNSFTCNLCGEFCGTSRNLRYHRKFSCSKCLSPCSYCPRKFVNDKAASRHITLKHQQLENVYKAKSVKCTVCEKLISKRYIDYHTALHDSNADLTKFETGECPECGKKFYKNKSHSCQRNSFMFKDNDANLTCTLCLNQFENKKDVVKHLGIVHLGEYRKQKQEGDYFCPFPGCEVQKGILANIKRHLMTIHYRVKLYPCTVCGEKFDNILKKKRHIRNIHNITGEFQCDHCGRDFVRANLLREHIYVHHSDEKRFLCKYCKKGFKQSGELKRHLFVHEEHLSKYQCNKCDKRFRDRSTLKKHVNSHIKRTSFPKP